jgi:hypothetical protein
MTERITLSLHDSTDVPSIRPSGCMIHYRGATFSDADCKFDHNLVIKDAVRFKANEGDAED